MRQLSHLILFVLLSFTIACSSDSEEDLLGVETCNETNISFSEQVLPILNANCSFTGCHSSTSPAAGIDLSNYDATSSYLDSDQARFLGAIRHESGFSPMPKNNDKLTDCDLYYIETWIAEGALNN